MQRLQTTFLCALLLAPAASQASVITMALLAPSQTGAPGSTLIFDADFTNTSTGDIDLGAANVTFGGPWVVDTTPFLNGPATVSAGTSSGYFEVFTVFIPASAPHGALYSGVLSVTDINDNLLATAGFQAGTTAAPEPGSGMLMLMTTVGSLAWLVRRKVSSKP